jgi:hypothetical protein
MMIKEQELEKMPSAYSIGLYPEHLSFWEQDMADTGLGPAIFVSLISTGIGIDVFLMPQSGQILTVFLVLSTLIITWFFAIRTLRKSIKEQLAPIAKIAYTEHFPLLQQVCRDQDYDLVSRREVYWCCLLELDTLYKII